MVNSWLVCICNIHVFDIRKMKALKNFSGLTIIGVSGTFLVVFLKNICEMPKSVCENRSLSLSFWIVIFPVRGSKLCRPPNSGEKRRKQMLNMESLVPTSVHLSYRVSQPTLKTPIWQKGQQYDFQDVSCGLFKYIWPILFTTDACNMYQQYVEQAIGWGKGNVLITLSTTGQHHTSK